MKAMKAGKAAPAAKVETKVKAAPKAKATPKAKVKVAKAEPVLKKKPAAAPVDMTKKNAPMPKPPTGCEAPPSNYNGGRIYYKTNIKAFRVIRKFPIFGTEKKVKWAKDRPTIVEWKSALKAIDEYKP